MEKLYLTQSLVAIPTIQINFAPPNFSILRLPARNWLFYYTYLRVVLVILNVHPLIISICLITQAPK